MFHANCRRSVYCHYYNNSFCLTLLQLIYLLSGAVSVKDMLFIDDFIPIEVIQLGYFISSMQRGCLHGLYKGT